RALAAHLARLAEKIGAELGQRMLNLARTTIMGVMVGIVGTAAAQALVALVGFLIAGVPAPLLLSSAVFFLSMVPVGPPLIWGGAAWWLYNQGATGMAIFMVIWGVAVISSVDNFLKPILISRTSSLPILLIALGVFGGILAFGFVGIFLGPVILALALTLIANWSSSSQA
ncbi:MAG: AI-2E family transporter, partial [Rhodocyclaceae bacterium]|nr:AI-2E family transporter [Rhodocyclaceae bacterium]